MTSTNVAGNGASNGFGTNSWLVDEMYEQYLDDPDSVTDAWRAFFADANGAAQPAAVAAAPASAPAHVTETAPPVSSVVPSQSAPAPEPLTAPAAPAPAAPAPAAPAPVATAPAPAAPATPPAPRSLLHRPPAGNGEAGKPIKGAAAAIATNMEKSLTVPTATTFRNVPAKLLEVNRKVVNGYRARTGMGKISFTHIIGFAVIRAISDTVPAMRNSYTIGADGKPRLVVNEVTTWASPSTSTRATAPARSSFPSSRAPAT